MNKHLIFFFFLLFVHGVFAQNINKDSIILKSKSCYKKKNKISFTLENHTGQELLRINPMAPLSLFKWNGNEWMQVTQLGYCSCGLIPCPAPPEFLPFADHDAIDLDWDQMESRCVDNEKGTKEFKWAGKGKYKVVFEFKTDRQSESIQIVKEFRIR